MSAYDDENARYWRASAMIARAGGRLELANLWEERAHQADCGRPGSDLDFRGHSESPARIEASVVDYVTAQQALDLLYVGRVVN